MQTQAAIEAKARQQLQQDGWCVLPDVLTADEAATGGQAVAETVHDPYQREVAKRTMTERRFRHMPIMHDGKLVGIVSMGDLVRSQLTTAQSETRYLRDYIAGYYT